uniref:Apolipoprotein L, 1 n=1 Tax=Oncorhynchus kisutch TaxID=8019 RepID=A0A8C7G4E8_ONCKI
MFKRSSKPAEHSVPVQDNLSVNTELSASNVSLDNNTKEKGGMFKGIFKKSPKPSQDVTHAQDHLSTDSELSSRRGSDDSLIVNINTKEKGGVFSGMFRKSPKPLEARTHSQGNLDDLSTHSDLSASTASHSEKTPKDKERDEDLSGSREKLTFSDKHFEAKQGGIMGKMFRNPFNSSTQDKEKTEDTSRSRDKLMSSDKHSNAKDVKSNLIQRDRKEGTEMPAVAPRPTEEVGKQIKLLLMSNFITSLLRLSVTSPQQELKGTALHDRLKKREMGDNQANRNMIPRERTEKTAETPEVPPRPTEEDQSDDLKEGESLLTGEKEEGEDKDGEAKMKKPRRHNPFMPRGAGGKGKAMPKKVETQPGATGSDSNENDGGNKSLFDQLEEFRVNPAEPEEQQDMDGLMDWWGTVEQWEDMPQEDDLTEKEEAKAFAVTAEKVQKGIRVFNKLFSERAESLWQHVIDLNSIADALDCFNKKTKIAQITGGSTSAVGGVCTIVGLALAPVTMGTSLIITAVGLSVATAGGLTSAGAGLSNTVNNSMDRKKVEAIVTDYQKKMTDINKCMLFIKQGIESLRRFDLMKMKKHAYNRDFPGLNNIYEDGAMAGKAILINANEIMRVVQIANVAGSTAARAVQIASMATGVLTGLFVGMDIYFVAKDSKELKKGAKSEFAAKIREVATQLHDGLVELNGIRVELQSTDPDNTNGTNTPDSTNNLKKLDSDDDTDNYKTSDSKSIVDNSNTADNSHKTSKA